MIAETFENMVLPITEFKKHIGKYLKELTSPKILLTHNKPSAVLVPYEQFKAMEKIIEKQMDLELLNLMEERLTNPNAKYVEHDEFFKSLGV